MRGFCVAWEDSGIIAIASAPTSSSASRAAMSRYLPIERRLPAIAASQADTTAPPTRGRGRTSSPAAISTTPTSRMNVRPSTGSRRSTLGLRYRSQSTSRLVNLSARRRSAPDRILSATASLHPTACSYPQPESCDCEAAGEAPKRAGALLLRHRDPQLHATILRPALWRDVGGDRLSLAHPDGLRPLLRDSA